jgi:hypothetical protein
MDNKLKRLLFIAWVIIMAGCTPIDQGKGTLTGHVTIGPLVPVLREGEQEPTPSPEVYAAWQIVVYTEDMKREVARADIDAAGNYQIVLPVNSYMVTAAPTSGVRGPGGSSQHLVVITQDAFTYLDLDIDTGIR